MKLCLCMSLRACMSVWTRDVYQNIHISMPVHVVYSMYVFIKSTVTIMIAYICLVYHNKLLVMKALSLVFKGDEMEYQQQKHTCTKKQWSSETQQRERMQKQGKRELCVFSQT